MRAIRLKNGSVTYVDDSDFYQLRKRRWYFDRYTGYAKTHVGRTRPKLHRFLMPPRAGLEVDHVNRDKLDNRRANLRYVTHGENGRNCLRKDCTSGVRGVSRRRPHENVWVARIKLHGRYQHLGSFATKELAAAAYVAMLEHSHSNCA